MTQLTGPVASLGGPRGSTAKPSAYPLVWRKASENMDHKAAAVTAMRNNGFTTALFGVRGVLTPGEDALVALAPGEKATVLSERAAVNVNMLSRGSAAAYPSTLMGAVAYLRQSFYDAVNYRNTTPVRTDARLEALAGATDRKYPVLVAANNENDIHRALRLGTEFGLTTLVVASRETAKTAEQVKKAGAAVLLSGDWSEAPALQKAGVKFALVSGRLDMDASDANALRERAGRLVASGLAAEAVLAALTRVPAELLGVGDRLGTVAPGKLAHLVVTEGDLLSKEGKVKFVVVQGKKVDPVEVAADPRRKQTVTAADGTPFRTVTEDDADLHGTEHGHDGEGGRD
jgi:hypothetical protein